MRRREKELAPTFVLRDDLHQLVLLSRVRVEVVLQHRPLDHSGSLILARQLKDNEMVCRVLSLLSPERVLQPLYSCCLSRRNGPGEWEQNQEPEFLGSRPGSSLTSQGMRGHPLSVTCSLSHSVPPVNRENACLAYRPRTGWGSAKMILICCYGIGYNLWVRNGLFCTPTISKSTVALWPSKTTPRYHQEKWTHMSTRGLVHKRSEQIYS